MYHDSHYRDKVTALTGHPSIRSLLAYSSTKAVGLMKFIERCSDMVKSKFEVTDRIIDSTTIHFSSIMAECIGRPKPDKDIYLVSSTNVFGVAINHV